MEPYRLSLAEAARAIREGELTSEALTRSCLERIRAKDPDILAWEWLDADTALAAARACDARKASGPLHGIPLGMKDIIYTRGVPTRMGSPIYKDFVPAHSAACVEYLEAAGAFVMGKTVTTEFANQKPGKTRNPWNPEYTPGGSSSGSAAAVAAGFVPAALGSQTRGSTIRPAVFCGVVGYKPSFGLVSRFAMNPLSQTLDHVGIITRTADDAALMASCMARYDVRDAHSLREEDRPAEVFQVERFAQPPRLAFVRSPLWHLAEAPQRELFEASAGALRKAGAHVAEVELPTIFDGAIDVTRVIHYAEIAFNYRELMARHANDVSERFAEFYKGGLEYSAADYLEALQQREKLRASLAALMHEYDAIVTPPATGELPRGLGFTGDANFCTIWTLCGVPCVSFPTALGPHGLPLGLQVVGGYLKDRVALGAAKWCMEKLPFRIGTLD